MEQEQQDKRQQDRRCNQRNRQPEIEQHGVRRDAERTGCLLIFYTVPAHQKPVGIDAVRGTGNQGTEILPFLNSQQGGVVRLDDVDLIHLVGKRFVQHPQDKDIPFG